ncbi:hypothetical protein JK359_03065 [Streptomyces actinomycinicus]|uniref:Uncharacterized protein n=1 Tax=Streptomyces actinomycinicus TaxID=1695166 RepID=A0A937EDK9_9ACTN|nr:hypothetical protein [Streptomyces actinomycinicus]MBL1080962.1 hypothetical protein [Streptomyces actinomycinicus]
MSRLALLNPEVMHVIAGFAGIAVVCVYALLVMLVRKVHGRPPSGLPPRERPPSGR